MRRVQIPGVPLHLIRRGINRAAVFGDKEDYEFFLALLETSAARHDVAVHSYVLMTNHYHLIATPGRTDAVPPMMRDVNRAYSKRFNRRYERIGTMWTGPYRDISISDERYLLTCLRYVEQNPVRAQMVSTAEDYAWSTYRVHALGEPTSWLVPHSAYVALGATPADRQAAYRTLCELPLGDHDLVRQRHALGRVPVARHSELELAS
jgi:putative transposase